MPEKKGVMKNISIWAEPGLRVVKPRGFAKPREPSYRGQAEKAPSAGIRGAVLQMCETIGKLEKGAKDIICQLHRKQYLEFL